MRFFTRFTHSILAGMALVSIVIAGQASALTAAIDPSRTMGVAPLMVIFDGTGTDHTDNAVDEFKHLAYEWNFGETANGNPVKYWTQGSKVGNAFASNKDYAHGPVAGHVYDLPGVYTVTLDVTDRVGVKSSQTVMITVLDPESVYSATTYCFSNSSNFTGCPTSSSGRHITTNSFDEVLSYVTQGTRVLMRRGDTFNSTQSTDFNHGGPVTVGAFPLNPNDPMTNRPRVNGGGGHNLILMSSRTPAFSDFRFMDTQFVGGSGAGHLLYNQGRVHQLLLYRSEALDFERAALMDTGIQRYWDENGYYGQLQHDQIGFVDCELGVSSAHTLFVAGQRMMINGNYMHDSFTHVLRISQAQKSVIQHNYLLNAGNQARHALKLHASMRNYSWPHGPLEHDTYEVVVSDNLINGGPGYEPVEIGPQSNYDEYIFHILYEGNHVVGTDRTQWMTSMATRDSVIRNNILDMTGVLEPNGIQIRHRDAQTMQTDRDEIYNNTCYAAGDFSAPVRCVVLWYGQDHVVSNNLVYAPDASREVMLDTEVPVDVCSSCNVSASGFSSSPFVSSSPSAATDFALKTPRVGESKASSTYLGNKGAAVDAPNRHDFSRQVRVNSEIGVGAHQFIPTVGRVTNASVAEVP